MDAKSGAISDRIPLAGEPGGLVSGAGAIWAESTIDGTISRVDPATEQVTQTVPLEIGNAAALGFGQGRLWVADTTGHSLVEVFPRTGKRVLTLPLDLRPTSIAVGKRAVWVADHDSGLLARVNPTLGVTEAIIHVGQGPAALALGENALWVANSLDSTVSRIDPATNRVVATIPVGSGPVALAVSDGAVWVANQSSGDLSRIDPLRNRVTRTIRVGGQPSAVAIAARQVWVGGGPSPRIHRGGTLTIVSTSHFRSIDPAIQTEALQFQFARLAYDGLVAIEAAPGPAGLRLVPDLAIALPTPTAGGTLYTFRLRNGIRYSDGRPLRASDFRRSMERMFQLGSPGAGAFLSVLGAERCRKDAPCDLSRGVRSDDSGGTVSFRLRRPDPDFLFKFTSQAFTAPVPAGTPPHDVGTTAVPATGPYRIVRSDRQEVRFERNPFFHEWSYAAQPDGNPDAIVWRFVPSTENAIAQVEKGHADWLFGLLPPAALHRLQIERPAQLHTNPTLAVDAVNMHPKPPFDDIRVRRALSYAIDRRVIVRLYGGPAVATPHCQTLLPGLLGFERYCPYTLHPRRDGRWTAPNLALARRLVAASAPADSGSSSGAPRTSRTSRTAYRPTSPPSSARSAIGRVSTSSPSATGTTASASAYRSAPASTGSRTTLHRRPTYLPSSAATVSTATVTTTQATPATPPSTDRCDKQTHSSWSTPAEQRRYGAGSTTNSSTVPGGPPPSSNIHPSSSRNVSATSKAAPSATSSPTRPGCAKAPLDHH